jgi:membrane-associated protease RseP (regulator of RpoE activity)
VPLPDIIEQVRAIGDRPLPADWRQRQRIAIGAAAAIIVVGAAFLVFSPDHPVSRPVAPRPALAPTSTPSVTTSPTPPPTAVVRVSRRELRAVRRAARRFLAGYLPFTYGRGSAHRIPAATSAFRTDIAHNYRPRVPPSERRRRTKIRHLEAEGASASRATVVALVSDGARTYSVAVAMRRIDGHWLAFGLRAG